ncbi:MAG: nucleotidyltransferase family protein [Rudaea sp.]|uniref:nucleotidyltransferase family protein n=1 Tax=Rudaea sp. TaxID=2136325 RepID=UPI0039E2B182
MPGQASAHGVVVLAAGASQRLGQPKQLLLHHGETLVRRAARLAVETRPRDAVVVLGFDADSISRQMENLPIRRVDCTDWRLGLGTSLRAGVDALLPECAGVLVLLCDQPELDAQHLASLCRAWGSAADRGAASFYANRLGAPALLPRTWFDALDAGSDRGMRDLLAQRAGRIDAIANEALALDVDRPDDLRRLS